MVNVNFRTLSFGVIISAFPTTSFPLSHFWKSAQTQSLDEARQVECGPKPKRSSRKRWQVHLNDAPSTKIDQMQREKPRSITFRLQSFLRITQLVTVSFIGAIALIHWEELSSTHPMRSFLSSEIYLGSTVRGMAFGSKERQRVPWDIEPESLQSIPSYNEIMLQHRTRRVPTWSESITILDVKQSVRNIQLALRHLLECEHLSADYKWEELATALRDPILMDQLDQACDTLNRASEYLSLEARSEIGFDFGSCAWRHCGAFADFREAIDELDHLVGILEPFEANFVLDVAERGLRDVLAVSREFQDSSITIPDYKPLLRQSERTEGFDGPVDMDYLQALEFLKNIEHTSN